jgi:hypothetical protein
MHDALPAPSPRGEHPLLSHTGCLLNILQRLRDEGALGRAAAVSCAWHQAASTGQLWRDLHLHK